MVGIGGVAGSTGVAEAGMVAVEEAGSTAGAEEADSMAEVRP